MLDVASTGNWAHFSPVNSTRDGKPYPYDSVGLDQHAGTSGTFAQKGTQYLRSAQCEIVSPLMGPEVLVGGRWMESSGATTGLS